MLFGHLAVSALEHRYANVEFVPVMAAAVLPDVVDKISHYVLGQTATGRLWGHTLVGVVVSSMVVWLAWGRRSALSWAVGYLSHLVCDIGGVVPWLHPFVTYQFPPAYGFETTLGIALTNYPRMALETALLIWAFVALRPRLTSAWHNLVARYQAHREQTHLRPSSHTDQIQEPSHELAHTSEASE